MKRLSNIAFLLFFAIAVSSCVKEELDAPSESAGSQAIMAVDSQDQLQKEELKQDIPTPFESGINDDGDNEDEGINKKGPSTQE